VQVFLHQKTCARKLAQITRSHYASFLFKKVVICFGKIQSPVDRPAAEFHDRNLPEIERVLFLPVSGASFLYQKNGTRNPVHMGKFSGARNLHQKLASLNSA